MRRESRRMEAELSDLSAVLEDSLSLLRELELRRIDAALHIKKTARHTAKWRRAVSAKKLSGARRRATRTFTPMDGLTISSLPSPPSLECRAPPA